jgi:hypothetical protein
MSDKQAILDAVQAMADDATAEEILRRLAAFAPGTTEVAKSPERYAWPTVVSAAERAVMEPGPLSNDEIARRGQELYERDLRAVVEPEHTDRVIAIDISSGAYALGDSVLEATARLREDRPAAVSYCRRVGPRPLRSFGWFPRRHA